MFKLNRKSILSSIVSNYVLILITMLAFWVLVDQWSVSALVVMLLGSVVYAFLYMLPGLILVGLVCMFTAWWKSAKREKLISLLVFLVFFVTNLLLVFDFILMKSFGFHFNLLIWNLLTTPGGFASMGLRSGTVVSLSFGIVILFALHLGVFKLSSWINIGKILNGRRKYLVFFIMVILGVVLKVTYGYNQYKLNSVPLMAAQHIPGFFSFTMRGTLRKLGVKEPDRDAVRINSKINVNELLNYPTQEIKRDKNRKQYNVVWLACESLRWDMLTEEVMPATSKFAEKGTNFKLNYSGGNGTRHGMFSMFYGIYGNYWDVFMKNRRSPVLMDWMVEDGYDFNCQTSARFSYPEFDQTIFSGIASEKLYSFDQGPTWKRDQHNTTRFINYLKNVDRSKPFMSFMFFESTHAPYEFPENAIIEKDYAPALNYATVDKSNGPAIKKRYINSARHLDMCLSDIFQSLESEKLLDNTIVILVGDHGEEFFEKGRLGHNSAFVQEQIRTPLVIYFPDREGAVYDGMSSHLDIVPMLAPYFGVKNVASDYCLGQNLLDGKSKRNYAILADWSKIFFVGEKYKTYLPNNSAGYAMQVLCDTEDRPLPSVDKFYAENKEILFKIQKDMSKFMR